MIEKPDCVAFRDGGEGRFQGVAQRLHRPWLVLLDVVLHFRERLFNRVEFGRVGRQEDVPHPAVGKELPEEPGAVDGVVVQDQHLAARQQAQHVQLEERGEPFRRQRAGEQPFRGNPVRAHRGGGVDGRAGRRCRGGPSATARKPA